MVRRSSHEDLFTASPPRIGVEHEFQIFDAERSLDARVLLPTLDLDGGRWDPGDRHAVRCRWGGVITADGREAEIATPPVPLTAGATRRVEALTDAGRSALLAALSPDHCLRGYSTHLNVGIPDRRVVAVSRDVATRMAPAVMLLLDRRDSPGLIVRPRHGRLEIGGEFAAGLRLRRALVMACGAALLAHRARHDRSARARLPPRLRLRVVPSPQRYGLYVDRRAGGGDLYSAGRSFLFERERGGTISADDVLAETWQQARDVLAQILDEASLIEVDELIAGDEPLPASGDAELYRRPEQPPPADPWPTPLAARWVRGQVTVATVAATWHKVVLRVDAGGRTRWLTVPGDEIDGLIGRLTRGELDAWLHTLVGA